MLFFLGFGLTMLIGCAVASRIAAGGEASEPPMGWSITEVARMQGSMMGALGGVSITSLVLILSFTRRDTGVVGQDGLDAVAIILVTAFAAFIHCFFTLSLVPERAVVGERVTRFYYGLAATMQCRTVVLLLVGQSTFVDFYGLERAAETMNMLIPGGMVAAFIVVAMVADQLGLIRFGESCLVALSGLVLAGMLWAASGVLDGGDLDKSMAMTIIYPVVNGFSLAAIVLVQLSPSRPLVRALIETNARLFAMIELQITVQFTVILWMAVKGLV